MSYRFFTMLCWTLVILTILSPGALAGKTNLETSGVLENNSSLQNLSDNQEQINASVSAETTLIGKNTVQVKSSSPLQVSAEYVPEHVIVRYKTDTISTMSALPSVMSTANAEVGASVMTDYSEAGLPGMQVVQVKGVPVDKAIQEYTANPNVLYAEPDYLVSLPQEQSDKVSAKVESVEMASMRTPNDPSFSLQWGLKNSGQGPFYGKSGADIKASDAWGTTTGSSSVIIAVVDTGVDYTHSDLAANIWTNSGEIPNNGIDDDGNGYIDDVRGWNFVSNSNNPMDDHGHGTHCAGTIAAVGNNNIGITGVCWNAKIMPLKFLDSTGNGRVSNAISAILYANKKGAQVISNSWGGTQYTQALKDAIDASSAVVVCAAGNSGQNSDTNPQYPAAMSSSNIISVAATDSKDNLASFSNYGSSSVDLAAPGVTIYSTYKNNQYQYLSGTSMATPFVSGVAGLVKAANPSLSKNQVRDRILNTVDKLSSLSGKVATGGRLNAASAVGSVSPSPTVTPTPTSQPGVLTASFMASPVSGRIPLRVQFIDTSIGQPTTWAWNFGDGGYSYQKNPVYTFTKKGAYSVRLTISRSGKMSTAYKSRYITAY
ncbi:S8 family serine peptidase [Methanospirillum lacunae]|uniref:Peptidase S8/S53 subtilisin kexin sedolisin n=1 Tax=Methanospirillum lacunae TaxID=668570 RepID=A0A2V2N7V6_9EURY|nr:S8 family serine peptidase [Methanospirillum lacunae]PWR72327.1 peptidase S8/S53 subtilisin kexin sedolisin [Methanospirillum lacunae]